MPAATPLDLLSFWGTFLLYLGHAGEFHVTALSFKGWRRQQLVFGAGVGCVGKSFYGSRNLHSHGAIMEDQLSLRMMFLMCWCSTDAVRFEFESLALLVSFMAHQGCSHRR